MGWRGCCGRVALTSDGARGTVGRGDGGVSDRGADPCSFFFLGGVNGTAWWWSFGWYDGGVGMGAMGWGDGFTTFQCWVGRYLSWGQWKRAFVVNEAPFEHVDLF